MNELHHAHIFASDIDATLAWWTTVLGAEVAFDGRMAGARNVFLRLGRGRIHVYDQPPRAPVGCGAVHHLGVRTDDLRALVAHMRARGVAFRSEIREFGHWRYVMVAAPDDILLELFEVDPAIDAPLAAYFGRM